MKKLVNFFRNDDILFPGLFDMDGIAFFVFQGDSIHVGEAHDAMWAVGFIPDDAFIVSVT